MTTLRDALLDALERGEGEIAVVQYPERDDCAYPDILGTSSYNKGCRCSRCRSAHNAAGLAWLHRHPEYAQRKNAMRRGTRRY